MSHHYGPKDLQQALASLGKSEASIKKIVPQTQRTKDALAVIGEYRRAIKTQDTAKFPDLNKRLAIAMTAITQEQIALVELYGAKVEQTASKATTAIDTLTRKSHDLLISINPLTDPPATYLKPNISSTEICKAVNTPAPTGIDVASLLKSFEGIDISKTVPGGEKRSPIQSETVLGPNDEKQYAEFLKILTQVDYGKKIELPPGNTPYVYVNTKDKEPLLLGKVVKIVSISTIASDGGLNPDPEGILKAMQFIKSNQPAHDEEPSLGFVKLPGSEDNSIKVCFYQPVPEFEFDKLQRILEAKLKA